MKKDNVETLNALQIAVYAVNCPNSDGYVDEICELIKHYSDSQIDLLMKEIDFLRFQLTDKDILLDKKIAKLNSIRSIVDTI